MPIAMLENPIRLIMLSGLVLFLVTLVTQIAIPLTRDTPLFPLFGRKPRISRKIRTVNEEAEEQVLMQTLEQKRQELNKKRQRKPLEPRFEPTVSMPKLAKKMRRS